MVLAASKASMDVGLQMSKDYKEKQAQNRKCLLAIVSTVRFLARQGLPLRGASRGDSSGSGEINSNFMQLLLLRKEEIPDLDAWLEKSQDRFTSPDIQNEFLQIMALTVLRGITERLTDRYFSIMVDETTDISNVEQLVFCIRFVDGQLNCHEEFIGLHSMDSISADSIIRTIDRGHFAEVIPFPSELSKTVLRWG